MRKLYLYLVLWWNNYCLAHGLKKEWSCVQTHKYGSYRTWEHGCPVCLENKCNKAQQKRSLKLERDFHKQEKVEQLQKEFKRTVLGVEQ